VAEKRANKQIKDTGNKENKSHHRHGQDRSPRGPPSLQWDAFISLLEENKEEAFELHAFVATPSIPEVTNGRHVAMNLAKAVKQATGFRFK
jgi:hypothetical protein